MRSWLRRVVPSALALVMGVVVASCATSSAVSTCVKQIEPVAPGPPGAFMVLKTDGTVWLTPFGATGQFEARPPSHVAGLDGVESLADVDGQAATYCAVKSDHSLWCWGANACGTVGNGATSAAPAPVEILGP